jgi:hypothetical protein
MQLLRVTDGAKRNLPQLHDVRKYEWVFVAADPYLVISPCTGYIL